MDPNTFVPGPPPPPVQQPPQQEQPPATAEDMMAFINDLQARQKHLEDQLQLANQRLQQQSNWVPPPPPGPPPRPPTPPLRPPPPPPPHSPLRPPPVTKRPKFAVPPKFTGKMADALPFLHSCQLYIKGRPEEFSDNRTTIYWICSFMQEGAAVEWRDNLIEAGEAGEQAPNTLEEFWAVFEADFRDPD
ncbi:hypothetical protein DXG01_013683 [Tephrocybe rancida]|nr:hypothetical protein DXG01_013683 [Tephrocybe rancida]